MMTKQELLDIPHTTVSYYYGMQQKFVGIIHFWHDVDIDCEKDDGPQIVTEKLDIETASWINSL